MHSLLRHGLLTIAILTWGTSLAQADDSFDEITNRSLLFLLREMDFDEVEYYDSASDDSWTRISFTDGDRTHYVFNYGETGLMLATYYNTGEEESRSTLAKVNEWNSTYRWSRSYITEAGTWVVESDLDLEFGATTDEVEAFVERWIDQLELFEEHIDF